VQDGAYVGRVRGLVVAITRGTAEQRRHVIGCRISWDISVGGSGAALKCQANSIEVELISNVRRR
jgi:hypothetical protein